MDVAPRGSVAPRGLAGDMAAALGIITRLARDLGCGGYAESGEGAAYAIPDRESGTLWVATGRVSEEPGVPAGTAGGTRRFEGGDIPSNWPISAGEFAGVPLK